MKRRRLLWSGFGAVVLFLAIGAGWIASLPPTPAFAAAPPIAQAETDATLAALKPPTRVRPLIAIVGINDATETTDYLMPYPALTVEPDATVAEFDARHQDGADYVIVPAMSRDGDPAALQWIRRQAAKGALIIGVCAGAKVVGAAGLLDSKRATTHWYYLSELRDKNPAMQYVADRRLVVDQGIATTTGITASMPMSLTLIEAIAGRDKAAAVGRDLGLTDWDARHVSAAFTFTRPFALTAIGNTLAFWNREQLGIELSTGIDEVSLALVADAWSRTYRSRAVTFAGAAAALETAGGIRILPDQVAGSWPAERRLPAIGGRPPAQALSEALRGIDSRYGRGTANVVAMQLGYPRQRGPQHD